MANMWIATNETAFLSLTIHYVDSSWELKNFLLDIIPISIRHTGVNIADAIMAVLHEFDLMEKTLALTIDNASSMLSCGTSIAEELEREFDNLNFAHYQCAAHILNLAVTQGTKLVNQSIKKVRALMSYIKSSHPLNKALKALCQMKKTPYLAPELDVKTRWNSTYYMLEKWSKMEAALNLLVADDRTVHQRYPNENDLNKIKDTMFLLEPFEHATWLLSASSYPTYGNVRFVFLGLWEYLLRYMNDDFSQSMVANAIYRKLDNYWPIMDEASRISSLLDSRTKLSAFKNRMEKNRAKDLVSNLTGYDLLQPNTDMTGNDLVDTRNYFQQLQSNSIPLLLSSSRDSIRSELEKYLAIPLEDQIDPLLW